MDKMNDSGREFSQAREAGKTSENKDAGEIKKTNEFPQAPEMGYAKRQPACKQNKAHKSGILKALQSFVIGGVALIAVASATILPPKDKPTVNISEVIAYDTYAEYSVDIDSAVGAELNLVIYNDYYKSELPVSAGETVGIVEGLTPNKSYTIAVKGNFGFGEKTLSNKTFRTLSQDQLLQTRFDGIETVCTCGVDGKFNFKLKFEDENDYWSGFSAVLETPDSALKVAFCEFSSDVLGWQFFEVSKLSKGGYRLTVTVASSDPKDREASIKTLYSGEIQI